jgi:hypothetical protein
MLRSENLARHRGKEHPVELIDKLNIEITVGLADPRINVRLGALGNTPMPMTPAHFGRLVAREIEKWARSSSSRVRKSNDQRAVSLHWTHGRFGIQHRTDHDTRRKLRLLTK